MESHSEASKDFIDHLKDFLNNALIELQSSGTIPPILSASKTNTPRSTKRKHSQYGACRSKLGI